MARINADVIRIHRRKLIGWGCAGCEEEMRKGERLNGFWVEDDGDPNPTAPARKKLNDHDDRIHGRCRPSWMPIFDDMVDGLGRWKVE